MKSLTPRILAASPPRLLALLAGICLLAAPPVVAQTPLSVSGTVARLQDADTVVVGGVAVTLHRVSRTVQGAIDSVQTGPDGTFRFRVTGDTTAIYLVSARYAGIEYFTEPLRPPGAATLRLVVSDTSSAAPVRLSSRHVIVRPPDPSGGRAVLDLVTLQNDGSTTRIGRDSLAPTFVIPLPTGALQPEVQEGDVSPTAIRFVGDTMLVLAPIAPGQKSVMVSYVLPLAVERPSWSPPADSFDLLVEEPGATVHGAGLVEVAPVELMGSTLRRWTAVPPTGGPGTLQFSGTAAGRNGALLWLVGAAGLLLLGGVWVTFRRARRSPPRPGASAPVDLVGALAQLDARYAGRRDQTSDAEWAAYEVERARLKAAALAGGRTRP